MKTISRVTGKTENEIKALYLSSIDLFMKFGASNKDATRMAQEAMTKAIYKHIDENL